MTRLVCELWASGHHLETVALERDRIVIGAAQTCDVEVDGDGVADEHALVKLERGDLVIAPRGSARVIHNGRVVAPMQRPPLWSGDVVELGRVQIIVEVEAPPAPAGVQVPVSAARRASAGPPLHAALLVTAAVVGDAHRRTAADALLAYLVDACDPRVAPWALAEIVDREEPPADDVAKALCRSVARHATLASLLPRIASHAGWGLSAGWAYHELSAELRRGFEHALLGHPSWDVRLSAALSVRDLAERERALRAVRRSFVASDFSPPRSTQAARPDRRIDVERGPDLPSLSDRTGDAHVPRAPLVLDPAEQALVTGAREAELAAAMTLLRAMAPAT